MRTCICNWQHFLWLQIEGKLNYLVSARPTAVNIKLAADELINLANSLSADESVTPEEFKERFVLLEYIYYCMNTLFNQDNRGSYALSSFVFTTCNLFVTSCFARLDSRGGAARAPRSGRELGC